MSTIVATFKELITDIPSTGNSITHTLFSSNNDIWCNIVCTGSEGSFITVAITGYSETFKYRLLPNLTASINLKGIISRMINYAPTKDSLTDLQERTDTIKQFEITFSYGAATDVKILTVLKAAQQVQSVYGEFASEYTVLDEEATEEQYKFKFLSCFENPVIYSQTSGGDTLEGVLVDFTNPSLYSTVNALIENNQWHIQNGNEGTVYLLPNTFPTTISNVDAYYRLRYSYENVSSPVLKMYYYLDNGAAYPSVGVEMYTFSDFQNGTDIGNGMKELILHSANYTPNSPSWRLEVIILSGDVDLYIHDITTYYITAETVTSYPFTIGIVNKDVSQDFNFRCRKTQLTTANNDTSITTTQKADLEIIPTETVSVVEVDLTKYLDGTNNTNRDKFIDIWCEVLPSFISFTTDQTTLSTMGMYFEFSENSSMRIDWGDGNIDEYSGESSYEIYHDYLSEGIYNGKIIFSNNANVTTINISGNYGNNQLTNINIPKECINLQYLGLQSNQLTSFTGHAEWVNLQYLILDENELTSFTGQAEWVNLQGLNLFSNQLTSFTGQPEWVNLQGLDLSTNQLTSFTGQPEWVNLKYLYLYSNQLTSFVGQPEWVNLQQLFLYSNQLTSFIGRAEWINLQYLDLSTNQLTSFIGRAEWINLQYLYLHLNQLATSEINSTLAYVVALGTTITDKYIQLQSQTPPAPPSGQGVTDKATLISRGYTVETD